MTTENRDNPLSQSTQHPEVSGQVPGTFESAKYVNSERKYIVDIGPLRSIGFECVAELSEAMANWPKFNSAHEGYAVLLEEVDELWDHVKTNQKRRDHEAMRKECIQIAAMAMRFALEVCTEEGVRK